MFIFLYIQIKGVIEKIQDMEKSLKKSNKIALLIIMTDGESSDGSIVEGIFIYVYMEMYIYIYILFIMMTNKEVFGHYLCKY